MVDCLPERGLWAAVVLQAVEDAKINVPVESREAQRLRDIKADATRFLQSKDKRPMSFLWICDQLGIEPGAIAVACGGE